MKKSLNAFLVVLLSLLGANSLASVIDFNVHKSAVVTTDTTSNDNGGERAIGNGMSREK